MRSTSRRFLAGLVVGVLLTLGIFPSLGGVAWLQEPDLSAEDRAIAVHMRAFVRALFDAPKNDEPASLWRPLVTDGEFSCAECHGAAGLEYDQAIEDGLLDADPSLNSTELSHERMISLMEDWVEQLNHDVAHRLSKAVLCIDCHERDPRRQ